MIAYSVILKCDHLPGVGEQNFVKTPTKTSIQLNTASTAVGFDMIMTVHTPPPNPPPGTLPQLHTANTAVYINTIFDNPLRLS